MCRNRSSILKTVAGIRYDMIRRISGLYAAIEIMK